MATPDPLADAIDGAIHSLGQLRHTLTNSSREPGWHVAYLTDLAGLDGPLAAIGGVVEALSAEVSDTGVPGADLAADWLDGAASSIRDAARDQIDRARDSLFYANR